MKDYAKILEAKGLPKAVFTKKEMNYLPEALTDDEEVLYAISGTFNGNTWLIVCTQKRLLFLDKGMVYGLKQIDIPLDKVNSVSFEKGMLLSSITIMNGAAPTKIINIEKTVVESMASVIKNAAEEYTASQNGGISQSSTASSSGDLIAQLRGLKALVDEGVITQEEFDAKKKQLLGI